MKQSERVGRNVVDNFETALEREGKDKGYIVAFSFTRGAYEEAARAKQAKDTTIQLTQVSELLEDVSELVTPLEGELLPPDLPLPEGRPTAARPSIEQLVESDQRSG